MSDDKLQNQIDTTANITEEALANTENTSSDAVNAGNAVDGQPEEQKREYSAADITVLEGLEAVRKRPSMYIGDTSSRGLHHLVYEVVDNSIDEVLAGYASAVDVCINEDNSITVKDDGRGIPVDEHKELHIPAVEVVMTVLHAGGKFDHNAYKVSGGLHGVGVSCVNALSLWMIVEIHRDGYAYEIRFERGKTSSKLRMLGPAQDRGTIVTFKPDGEIFTETTIYKREILDKRLRELAFLNRGVRISLSDLRGDTPEVEHYHYEGGISEFVKILNKDKELVHPDVVYMHRLRDKIDVEVALQYNSSFDDNIYSYVNNISTGEGGTHLVGFQTAITRLINMFAKKEGLLKQDKSIPGADARSGLVAIVSVKVPEPQFEGQTKTKLGNSEVKGIVDSIVYENLSEYFEEHVETAKMIVKRSLLSLEAREKAQRERESVLRKGALSGFSLPAKLVDCDSDEPEKCELFIVEGNSAGGTAKKGRNSEFQAIIPIRGKILNVEKANAAQIWHNEEIKSLISSIGCGWGNDSCDLSKLRYHKIIIMADADVDGSHIATLLLTFFYRQLRPLIEQGHVYIAKSPLYKVSKKKKERYIDNDEQLDKYLVNIGCTEVEVTRISTGEVLTHEQLMRIFNFVARGVQVEQGLHRHGVPEPRKFMANPKDGKYPIEMMIIHENDGGITETFVYTKEEEQEQIAEAEKRLPARVRPDDLPEDAPLGLHPAINLIRLYESADCEILGKDVADFGLDPKCIFDNSGEPIFRVKRENGTEKEISSLEELFNLVKSIGREGLKIQRYKGLGEMNGDQLRETTMDPQNRKMICVTIEDAEAAEKIFTLLMGDEVVPRREYIERHAAGVKDLDL